jgi:hypothetical protein
MPRNARKKREEQGLKRLLTVALTVAALVGSVALSSTVNARTPARATVQAQHVAQAVTVGKKKKRSGPTAGQLQRDLVSDAHKKFGTPSAKSASCVMPSKWKTGKTFKCFVYNSSGKGVGEFVITVLTGSRTEWKWNESWTPLPVSTPTPATAGPVIFTVTGSAPEDEFGDTINISYGTDTINDAGGTSLPWSATLPYINPNTDSNLEYNLEADLTDAGGSITCTITIQGKNYTSTANGADQGCDEEVSYFLGSWSAD